MNIFILNWRDFNHPKAGGAEAVTQQHAKRWVAYGHTVTWLTSSFAGASSVEIVDGVKIVRKAGSLSIYFIAPFYYFMHQKEFDIVVDEVHGIPFFTPLYVTQPTIVFIHEVAGNIWDFMYPFPLNILGRFIESLMFRVYRNVQFWTDAQSTVEELVLHGISRKNCVSIPCPITLKPTDLRPKKNVKRTYITIGRLVKMKGIEDVIKAFSLICKEEQNSQLWIVGSGDISYVKLLKKLVSKLSLGQKVKFWGKVSEIKKMNLLQRAHILLHASVKEGWGLVVLEAASQGTPSVVYNVAGLRDSVKNGITGVLIKKNTPGDLAYEAVRLVNDHHRYRKMQTKGLVWSQSFKWDRVGKQSIALLRKVSNT